MGTSMFVYLLIVEESDELPFMSMDARLASKSVLINEFGLHAAIPLI